MTSDVLFYLFAALTLVSGLLVVLNPFSRNPVTSAMFLVITIMGLAGLFVLLHAFFLAAVQILVYAGAVMVLFLFVIMMLDLKEERSQPLGLFRLGAAIVLVCGLLVLFMRHLPGTALADPGAATVVEGSTHVLGKMLLTNYLLPFELVSGILLVAMVGVVLLTKKDLK
jgi:NADH-quinone oxidoreductase subunit J